MLTDPTQHIDESVRTWLPSVLVSFGFIEDAKVFTRLAPLVDAGTIRLALPVLAALFYNSSHLLAQSVSLVDTVGDEHRSSLIAYRDAMHTIRWSVIAAVTSTQSVLANNLFLN